MRSDFHNFFLSLPTPFPVRSHESGPACFGEDLFDGDSDALMQGEDAIGIAVNENNLVEGEKGQGRQGLKVDLWSQILV